MSLADQKTKTKAKTRYLKAKKDRRKRRKTGEAPPRLNGDDHDSCDEEALDDIQVDEPAEEHRAQTPQAALPSFPRPVAPDAPSKSTLALQGVDKALLGAELIDPSRTLPLDAFTPAPGEIPVLSDRMKKRLVDLGIVELFAVQTALLPFLLPPNRRLRSLYLPYDAVRDVCASAPTGSGKTLAYVIPIVEILSTRISTKLRALIVLPTRDLVQQVQETLEAVSKGRGLKIGIATGQHSFVHEQAQLIANQKRRLYGGSSKVDILICTPGRLIDHLNGTLNFTLQHLRFLVIDEADRLLTQSFQEWLAQVLAAIQPPSRNLSILLDRPSLEKETGNGDDDDIDEHDALAPAWLHSHPHIADIPTDLDDDKSVSCQKLLFSATLTRDPSKIAAIGLKDPKYFVVQGVDAEEAEDHPMLVEDSFAMPATLKEHMVVCDTAQKPPMLFHIVHTHNMEHALVFTKSAESTTRLVRLFEFFEEAWRLAATPDNEQQQRAKVACAYSSDLSGPERKQILERFKQGEIDILVCSDLISRGIDISHVSHVISYDAPVDMRKYVHRVGRTARAGRQGDAWTLVENQEAHFFKTMMREGKHLSRIKKLKISEGDIARMLPCYETALSRLRDAYERPTS